MTFTAQQSRVDALIRLVGFIVLGFAAEGATVYLAEDVRHDRRVALKVLRPELAAVIGAERFLAEIKLTANLQHPHILPLFDSGEADGYLFYVMPFVTGETLRCLTRAAIGSERASSLLRTWRSGRLDLSKVPEGRRLGLLVGASQLLGIAIARHVLGVPALRSLPLEKLVELVSPAIDRCLNMNE